MILLVPAIVAATAPPVGAQDAARERVFDLHIVGGMLEGGRRTIRVEQQAAVRLRWTTTAPVEVHLHGYDVVLELAPGPVAEMAFKAHAAGRFPIHVHALGAARGGHHHAAPLAYLEVRPR
ncbi:MAG: hypothetical protein L6R19_12755 [Alphaproteobacteria bacterium]|nr:hypothetical protein [Alphaproteobacteria bacterium]